MAKETREEARDRVRAEETKRQADIAKAVAVYNKGTIPAGGNASVTYRYEPFVNEGK